MLPGLGGRLCEQLLRGYVEQVDVAVDEADEQQIFVVRVERNADDVAVGLDDFFWVVHVLQAVDRDHALSVDGGANFAFSIADGEDIRVFRVPLEAADRLLVLRDEVPERVERSGGLELVCRVVPEQEVGDDLVAVFLRDQALCEVERPADLAQLRGGELEESGGLRGDLLAVVWRLLSLLRLLMS